MAYSKGCMKKDCSTRILFPEKNKNFKTFSDKPRLRELIASTKEIARGIILTELKDTREELESTQ
jgi:hypothetical protein